MGVHHDIVESPLNSPDVSRREPVVDNQGEETAPIAAQSMSPRGTPSGTAGGKRRREEDVTNTPSDSKRRVYCRDDGAGSEATAKHTPRSKATPERRRCRHQRGGGVDDKKKKVMKQLVRRMTENAVQHRLEVADTQQQMMDEEVMRHAAGIYVPQDFQEAWRRRDFAHVPRRMMRGPA